MELRQLRYLTAILEHGSFGKAAEHLFIAQSALSAQMKKLEDELGCRPLVRSAQGVTHTPSGERLLVHARLILRQVSTAVDEVRQIEPMDVRGSVRLGLMSTVGRMMTIPLLEAMESQLPSLALHIVEALTIDLERMVDAGEIDLAVVFEGSGGRDPRRDRVLREEKLYLVSPGVTSAGSHRASLRPVPFAELGAFDLILPSARFTLRKMIDEECQRQGTSLRVKHEMDSLTQTLELINRLGCHSIMLLSTFYKHWLDGHVCAREISTLSLRPQTILTWNAENTSGAVAAVGELVARVVGQMDAGRQWPLTIDATQS